MRRTCVLRAIICILMCTIVTRSRAAARQDVPDEILQQTPEQLKKGIENQHPAAYYVLAMKLFKGGSEDEAVFWFYAGQLRYRLHLSANPKLDPSGDPALFSSLSAVIGPVLNEYAVGDLSGLVATIDRVLEWDLKTKNGFTSTNDHAKQWKETREGLGKLRAEIVRTADDIRKERTQNGLENRTTAKPQR